MRERVPRDLRQRSGEFDARRPAADDDERQQAALLHGIGLPLRRFESDEHLPANLERVLERLQSRRHLAPRVVPEVRVRDARRDDQVVVRRFAIGEMDDVRLEVDRRRLGEPDADVGLAAQDPADRRRDVARRKRGRGDLIEKRLEDVMVAPIDEQDVDRRSPKRARGAQAAKTAADDHHPRFGHGRPVCRASVAYEYFVRTWNRM